MSTWVTTTEWTATRKRCCVQAIREFARALPQLPEAEFSPPGRGAIILNIEGVAVSVYPLVLSRRAVRGRIREGAMLAVFQKNEPVGDRAGVAIAEILHRALQQTGLENLHPAECLVADVFRRKVFSAKPQNQRVLSNITSACREIAVRWPALRAVFAA